MIVAFSLFFLEPLNVDTANARSSKASQQYKQQQAQKKRQSLASYRSSRKGTKQSRSGQERPQRREQRSDEAWVEHAKQGQLAGKASWYGTNFHGGPTASGLRYDMYSFTAAHRTLPIGTVVKVTRQDSGKSVMVCVTDRGPFVRGRIIDLSYAAADQIGLRKKGVGDVNLEVVCNPDGRPLQEKQAFFVQFNAAKGKEKAGPFKEFADACAMQEALRQAHPEATVILDQLPSSDR
ncbi:MAG: septal ring lytic transglycosylase RlpA family protein [Desulfovibrio sp.]|nr:septal ring lytic transglycosylase RlpA family protein [Desulfovibrio sp.]